MKHLLVTNDFPPKIGGIQSLLWERWRRLPPERFAVLTSPTPVPPSSTPPSRSASSASASRCCCRTRCMVRRVDELAGEFGAELVVLDPAVPLGLIGPSLRAAVRRRAARRRGHRARPPARHQAGARPRAAPRPARRSPPAGTRPPRPSAPPAGRCRSPSCRPGSTSSASARSTPPSGRRPRRRFGLPADAELVLGVSRLVPRKGFDNAIRAVADRCAAPVPTWCWRSPAADATSAGSSGSPPTSAPPCGSSAGSPTTTCPRLYGCADVFAMLCRNRWGGLEQEGFGIVFVEAAACGVPQVAGDSGGAAEAVVDGETGLVVGDPTTSAKRPRACAGCSTTTPSGSGWARPRGSGRRPSSPTTCSAPGSARRSASERSAPHAPTPDRRERRRADRPGRHRSCTAIFGATAAYAAISFSTAAQWVGAVTAMTLFTIGVFAFLWSYWLAVQRSRFDEITVGPLYLLLGPGIPKRIRNTMLLTLLAQVVIATITTFARRDGPDGNPARRSPSASSCRCWGSGSTGSGQ